MLLHNFQYLVKKYEAAAHTTVFERKRHTRSLVWSFELLRRYPSFTITLLSSNRRMSSQVARLKAQIDNKKFGPAHHEQKARSQADRERIQIETAKKMAARFNLTYRALALSAAKKAAENRQKDIEAARQAKEAAAKYQMTARALKMSSTGTAKGKVNVLNPPTSEPKVSSADTHVAKPEPPKTVTLEELAAQQAQETPVVTRENGHDPEELEMLRATQPSSSDRREEEDEVGSLVTRKRDDDDASVFIDDSKFDVMSRITEATREQDHEEHDAFWMPVSNEFSCM